MLNAALILESITLVVRLVDNSMDGTSFLVIVEKLPIPLSSEPYYELNKKPVESETTICMVCESDTPVIVGGMNDMN